MNDFSIIEEIGSGKSVVYKSRRKKTVNFYAIKSVDKEHKHRVMNEVDILHDLNHENIVKFFEWYETPHHLWLIVEFCVGSDLKNLLKQDSKLPECTIRMFGQDLISGLSYLHSNGIIYCDLKPSNILIDGSGVLKLCDFALSRRIADAHIRNPGEHSRRGTPCYMAPECFAEEGVFSRLSDLWSLGCVLYEMAMGRPPFLSGTLTDLMTHILREEYPAVPSSVSPPLRDLLAGLLHKDPRQRLDWKHLFHHPFCHLPALPIPPQPSLDAYLQSMPSSLPPDVTSPSEVETMSRLASHNREREERGNATYTTGLDLEHPPDVLLKDADTELNFEESNYQPPVLPEKETEDYEPVLQKFVLENGTKKEAGLVIPPLRLNKVNGEVTPPMQVNGNLDKRARGNAPSKRVQSAPVKRTFPEIPKIRPLSGAKEMKAPTSNSPLIARKLTLDPLVSSPRVSTPRGGRVTSGQGLLSKVLLHPSDRCTQPLMEAPLLDLHHFTFPKGTPFPMLSQKRVADLPKDNLEAFIKSLYDALSSPRIPINSKMTYLEYFQYLCRDSHWANTMADQSSFWKLLAELSKKSKHEPLREKLLLSIAAIFRYATSAHSLRDHPLIQTLLDHLRDESVILRRAAMVTLGELLFYIANQEDKVPLPSVVPALLQCLHSGEGVLQRNIGQTIINMTSKAKPGHLWDSPKVLSTLWQVFGSAPSEDVRDVIAFAMVGLSRSSGTLLEMTVEHLLGQGLARFLQDGNSRVQQAYLCILDLALHQAPKKVQLLIAEDKHLIPSIKKLMESPSLILRGKAILTIHLLMKVHLPTFLSFCQYKVLPLLVRNSKEKDAYLRTCVKVTVHAIVDLVPNISGRIRAEIRKINEKSMSSLGPNVKPLKEALQYLPIVLHLITSSYFRSAVLTQSVIEDLSYFVTQVEELKFLAIEDLKSPLLNILEAIATNFTSLGEVQHIFISTLLPALFSLLQSSSGDTRFLALSIFTDILTYLLDNPLLYNMQPESTSSKQINDLISKQLLPNFKKILLDEEPIPPFGLKLLNSVTSKSKDEIFIPRLVKEGLLTILLNFLQLNHPYNNTYNMELIAKLTSSPTIDKQLLFNEDIVLKLTKVLEWAIRGQSLDQFLEPALEACYHLLLHLVQQKSLREEMTLFSSQRGTFLQLADFPEPLIAEKAAVCLELITHLSE
eukprot:TRINITY_DN6904_c0_g1_i1.p1 TRINITY_DN6904_c0_g1~~TRINITY_DN6904_c0_g1_i1.p1  ORF type:complete len:1184 (+),score=269.21 TRINITY_DN6904_c0_g1_i1:793-4344(+)